MNDEIEIIAEGKDVSIDIDKTLVSPILQNKEATPTKQTQIITSDEGYNGLSQVTVNPIPDDYVIPTGELEITANGNYNVKQYETANVSLPQDEPIDIAYNITRGNTEASSYFQKDVQDAKIVFNESGFMHYFKNCHGLKRIEVWFKKSLISLNNSFEACFNLENLILHDFDTSNITDFSSVFRDCSKLTILPQMNTSNATNFANAFQATGIAEIPLFDTHNVTNFNACFNYCDNLVTIPILDTSNAQDMAFMFRGSPRVQYQNYPQSLDNILQMCINAVNCTSPKTLASVCQGVNLVGKVENLPHYQAFLDAGWTLNN